MGGTSGGGAGGETTKDAGTTATGGAGGVDAGRASSYSGCRYIGGIDRAVVAKFDPQAGLCVVLALASPAGAPDASLGMTITQYWGVESAHLWSSTADDCAQRFTPAGAVSATSASGSVTVNQTPATIDIDAVLNFPASDGGPARSVELKAQGVDINKGC
jgi:hypothetical protein